MKVEEALAPNRSCLVGSDITLADIAVVSALVEPFSSVCDGAFRGKFPKTEKLIKSCLALPEFNSTAVWTVPPQITHVNRVTLLY